MIFYQYSAPNGAFPNILFYINTLEKYYVTGSAKTPTGIFYLCLRKSKQKFLNDHIIPGGGNTLEAKQFFKTRMAVTSFAGNAMEQNYYPAYAHLMIVTVDDDRFDAAQRTRKLDGYDAVYIEEDDLPAFNNCVTFVKHEVL